MVYLILDTNILVSALWRNLQSGKPAQILGLCAEGHYQAVYTQPIFEEYSAVLSRPKFGFTREEVSGVLDFFRFQALRAEPLFPGRNRPQCSDPFDQKFYDAACCWDALVITGNKKDYPEDRRVLTVDEFFEHRKLPQSKLLGAIGPY